MRPLMLRILAVLGLLMLALAAGFAARQSAPARVQTNVLCPPGADQPSFERAAFPMLPEMAAVTCFSGFTAEGLVDATKPVLALIDTRSPQSQGGNWCAPMTHNEGAAAEAFWSAANLGQVFGVALDSADPPNLYASTSTVYGSDRPELIALEGEPKLPFDGPLFPDGAETVYRIDGATGKVCPLAQISDAGPALGNLSVDPSTGSLYVSDFNTGLIHRYPTLGYDPVGCRYTSPPAVARYDHGRDGRAAAGLAAILDRSELGFTPLGRRVWAVKAHSGRLYYSTWWEDGQRPNATEANEIWSVGLDAQGGFVAGSARRENLGAGAGLPALETAPVAWSNPVASINFDSQGRMLLAERVMRDDVGPGRRLITGFDGHKARNLQYVSVAGRWLDSRMQAPARSYLIGRASLPLGTNSSGGVDFDCADNLWSTGHGLMNLAPPDHAPPYVYGLQRTPEGGNGPDTAGILALGYFIDFDGVSSVRDKVAIGSVAVYRNCGDPTLCLGDLVWADDDDDGRYEPAAGELPIAGVEVLLCEDTDGDGICTPGTDRELARTTTGADGLYRFCDLAPGEYSVKVDAANFDAGAALAGRRSSRGNDPAPDPDDDRDGDDNGVELPGGAVCSRAVTLALGAEPRDDGDDDPNTNRSLDFGFASASLCLGDLVWADDDDDGRYEPAAGELPIEGVALVLCEDTDGNGLCSPGVDRELATTMTGADGIYAFCDLEPGEYSVKLSRSNFDPGAALAGRRSSRGNDPAPDPDDDLDNDDNGLTLPGGTVCSQAVTLSLGDEPTDDGDADAYTNRSLDFGFAPTPTLCLGDLIWLDLDDDGRYAPSQGETPIAGVSLLLCEDSDGDGICSPGVDREVARSVSEVDGSYRFCELAPGDYSVKVEASNFDPGGPLAGHRSSRGNDPAPDPDDDVNDDDNGVELAGGEICSRAVSLSLGGEPTDDGDADSDTNRSVDFGFLPEQPASPTPPPTAGPSPTPRPTASPTPPGPSATPGPTSQATRPVATASPAASATPGGPTTVPAPATATAYLGCTPRVCPQIQGRVPEARINQVLADPKLIQGWARPLDPGKAVSRFNPRRCMLSIRSPGQPYAVPYNQLVWRAGCP